MPVSVASPVRLPASAIIRFAGIVSNGAVQITKDVNSAIPKAKIFGGDGVRTDSYTSAAKGGVPASLYPLIECTVATQNLTAYPGGKSFLALYQAKYGTSNPDPYAIYGYEVMKLGPDTIKDLGAPGNNKSAVLKALFSITDRSSVLGTYGFDKNGDTTLKPVSPSPACRSCAAISSLQICASSRPQPALPSGAPSRRCRAPAGTPSLVTEGVRSARICAVHCGYGRCGSGRAASRHRYQHRERRASL